MKPQLDKLYVYRPSKKLMEGSFKKLDHRHVKGQEIKFKRGNILERSESVHRYAKTITVNDISRTLLMITLDSDVKRVGKFFTDSKALIKKEESLYLTFAKADNKPVMLDITHVY